MLLCKCDPPESAELASVTNKLAQVMPHKEEDSALQPATQDDKTGGTPYWWLEFKQLSNASLSLPIEVRSDKSREFTA